MASFDVEEMHITSINVCLIKSNKWVSIVQTLLKYICKTKKYYIKKIYDYLNQSCDDIEEKYENFKSNY